MPDLEEAQPGREISILDGLILNAVQGQEADIKVWLAARGNAIGRFVEGVPGASDLAEVLGRTRRMEEKLLHWRRTVMMELSLIEQHLRFVEEQDERRPNDIGQRIDLRG